MRVVIADDEMLLRDGLAQLLVTAGVEVVGTAADSRALLALVAAELPDVAIIDIKMPPSFTDEGLVAAQQIQDDHPEVAVLVLSHYVEAAYAQRLLEHHTGGAGYLLKERVAEIAVLADALRRLCEGECVLDPTIVARLLNRPRAVSPLDGLTAREREVLSLMAEGLTNSAIAARLVNSPRTIETHVSQIFQKLDLDAPESDRRVLAVLTYLRH